MKTIHAVNVNDAYMLGIQLMQAYGHPQQSQHGETLEIQEPVSVCYANPRERVLFNVQRDSNPFLNFFEPLWILAGREDVDFLEYIVPNMAKYSDDGKRFHGAYGRRMRGAEMFHDDQVTEAITRLQQNPDDRQVVLTIRDRNDLWYRGKDTPCNLVVCCKVRNRKLNIQVFNRSNDFIWGMTGTNVCQFSMLQEYMADKIGVDVGTYHQTTDSFHVYNNDQWKAIEAAATRVPHDPYSDLSGLRPFKLGASEPNWDLDMKEFFFRYDTGHETAHYKTPFWADVVDPMWCTFHAHKIWRGDKTEANRKLTLAMVSDVQADDWHMATDEWLARRWAAAEKKNESV
jgi:thymidylate synthase